MQAIKAIKKYASIQLYLKKYRIKSINKQWIKPPENHPNPNEVVLIVCGFGSDDYKLAAKRLAEQAREFKRFTKIHVFTDLGDLPSISASDKSTIELLIKKNIRGWGLWSWKPIVVSCVMSFSPENAEIFYIDAGCEISPLGQAQFDSWRLHLQRNNYLFFWIPYAEREWTASIVLKHFKLPADLETHQIQATWFGLINCKECQDFVQKWVAECLLDMGRLLYGDKENHNPYLIEHREDQSVLSCIIKSHYKFPILPHRDHFIPELYYRNSLVLKMPIHTLRQSSDVSLINPLIKKSNNIGSFVWHIILSPKMIVKRIFRSVREIISTMIKIKRHIYK